MCNENATMQNAVNQHCNDVTMYYDTIAPAGKIKNVANCQKWGSNKLSYFLFSCIYKHRGFATVTSLQLSTDAVFCVTKLPS
jgi:hypothetical protein